MKFMPQTIRAVRKSEEKPSITSSGEKTFVSHTKNINITKLKRSRVIMRKGRVIFLSRGLTKWFKIPNKAPTKTRDLRNSLKVAAFFGRMKNGPVKSTPGTYFCARKRPSTPETICKNNLHNTL